MAVDMTTTMTIATTIRILVLLPLRRCCWVSLCLLQCTSPGSRQRRSCSRGHRRAQASLIASHSDVPLVTSVSLLPRVLPFLEKKQQARSGTGRPRSQNEGRLAWHSAFVLVGCTSNFCRSFMRKRVRWQESHFSIPRDVCKDCWGSSQVQAQTRNNGSG